MNINEALIKLNKSNTKHYKINNASLKEGKGPRVNPKIITVLHPDGYWDDRSNYPKHEAKYIRVEDGVKEIAPYQMYDCEAVTIELPDSVEIIGDGAFKNCGDLDDIDMPPALKELGEEAFANTDIREIEIPRGVTKISKDLFWNCAALETVKLHDGITSIGQCAFSGCEQLKNIFLPNSIAYIDYGAFENCGDENTVLTLPANPKIVDIKEATFMHCYFKGVIIPNSVRKIEGLAFSDCNFEQLIVPNSVEEIEDDAFETQRHSYSSIKNLILPDRFKNDLERIGIDPSKTKVIFGDYAQANIQSNQSSSQDSSFHNPNMSWADDLDDDEGNLDDED